MFYSTISFESLFDDPGFPNYRSLARSKIAKRSFSFLKSELPSLVEAALTDGAAPLNAALKGLQNVVGHHSPPAGFDGFLNAAISCLLGQFNIEPFDNRVPVRGPIWAGKWTSNYFRHRAYAFQDELDLDFPIVLVTSREELQVADAILEWPRLYQFGASLTVWSSASGFFEAKRDAKGVCLLPDWVAKRNQLREAKEEFENVIAQETEVVLRPRPESDESLAGNGRIAGALNFENEKIPIEISMLEREGLRVPVYVDPSLLERDEAFLNSFRTAVRLVTVQILQDHLKEPEPEGADTDGSGPLGLPGFKTLVSIDGSKGGSFAARISDVVYERDDGVYLFLDAHNELTSAANIRALRDAFYAIRHGDLRKRIILLGNDFDLPSDLTQEVRRVDFPLPQRRELTVILRDMLLEYGVESESGAEGKRAVENILPRVVDASLGMTLLQIEQLITKIANLRTPLPVDLSHQILRAKQQAIRATGALEIIPHSELPDHKSGGLNDLIEWIETRRKTFEDSDGARRHGIDRLPRGVLLMGISGTGKSLACKLIAKEWNVPLLRLDAGAVYDKFVGESEARIREALKVAETISPCILWVDEIDKGFSQGYVSDTSQRVLGTFLTWMQEHGKPVFTVAAANDVSNLPPELMRAGRFDNRFFLGCPNDQAREDILSIHLAKRGVSVNERNLDLQELALATLGFTGAELEQIILDALFESFSQGRDVEQADLMSFATKTKPLIATVGDKMDRIWEQIDSGRVVLASDQMLSRLKLMEIIDPYRYSPMYCRLECIKGFEREAEIAERLGAADYSYGPSICVLELDVKEWIYAQCTFKRDKADVGTFKFLDRFETIEDNEVFFRLLEDHEVESIVFQTETLCDRFKDSDVLDGLVDYFRVAFGEDQKES